MFRDRHGIYSVRPYFYRVVRLFFHPILVRTLFSLRGSRRTRVSFPFSRLFRALYSGSRGEIRSFHKYVRGGSGTPVVSYFYYLVRSRFHGRLRLQHFLMYLRVPSQVCFFRLHHVFL